jgi:dihydrofolate reductase
MGKVFISISMSLDGFIAGPNISPAHPLGEGGIRLHDWMFGAKTEADTSVAEEMMQNSGAVILGRRTYTDAIDGAWEGKTPFLVPAFVLCHTEPQRRADGFSFVTDGIESALSRARAVAGDKGVWLMGGANVLQQFIKAGKVDELQVSIAPVLFCAGTRLFDYIGTSRIELQNTRTIQTPQATHIRYNIVKS